MDKPNSMYHLNGNILCVVDTETTGLNPSKHEIVQIAVIALDGEIKPRKDIPPYYVNIAPEFPEKADPEALRVNKLSLDDLLKNGLNKEKSVDLFLKWIEKLDIPLTKWGTPKRIMPLGQNYAFDKAFIQNWMGDDNYKQYFDYQHRDTMISANYLNDRAVFHGEEVPYPKLKLTSLASKLSVPYKNAHDALQDCYATAEVYRRLLLEGVLG